MHVRDYRVFDQIDFILASMTSCDGVALEFHLKEFTAASNATYHLLPDHHMLSELLGEKKFAKYRQIILKAFQMDIKQFDRLLPLILINVISESIMTNSEQMPLDTFLWQQGEKMQKEMYGLESVEDQFRILRSIPLSYQLKALRDIIKNVNAFRKKTLHLLHLYEQQNIKQLYKVSKKSLGKQKHLLLFDRNKKMTQKISQLTQNGTLFTAVGAAHLYGKYGLVALLKREGFKVKPIYFDKT